MIKKIAVIILFTEIALSQFCPPVAHSNKILDLLTTIDKEKIQTDYGVSLFSTPNSIYSYIHPLPANYIYLMVAISDVDWDRIIIGFVKYAPNGSYVDNTLHFWLIGESGSGSQQFNKPKGVVISYAD